MDAVHQSQKQIDSFDAFFAEAEQHTDYWVAGAINEFTEKIVTQMEAQGVSRVELAARLDAKPSFVTRLLGGRNNFTLRKMVEIARALHCQVRLHLQPEGVRTTWRDYRIDRKTQTAKATTPMRAVYLMNDTQTWVGIGNTKITLLSAPEKKQHETIPVAA